MKAYYTDWYYSSLKVTILTHYMSILPVWADPPPLPYISIKEECLLLAFSCLPQLNIYSPVFTRQFLRLANAYTQKRANIYHLIFVDSRMLRFADYLWLADFCGLPTFEDSWLFADSWFLRLAYYLWLAKCLWLAYCLRWANCLFWLIVFG